ncbi:hypothetical protein AMATHDRAFT_9669 [Amanita thiersii Skay4041]|uniref:Uncharacterized protein n=1 Tax=Amanita thiersii Skay4041 TaxID=703135 RepID=A0A2A9NCA0_9AGAR|nr:hypothetical protein AMATHDRAFT_9669 [Amanita thiersii Skay4041]
MHSAAFDESQNIAQPIPSHPAPAFLSSEFTDLEINITGTLISLLALMDRPQASDFPSSMDLTFILQNIFVSNANNLLQTKGYVPSVQVKDMGKALAEEKLIQTDLLAHIIAYATADLNTKIADYMVASHGSSIPLIIYREIQEEWDYSGNTDNYLILDTAKTIQDNLDESFSS